MTDETQPTPEEERSDHRGDVAELHGDKDIETADTGIQSDSDRAPGEAQRERAEDAGATE